MKPSSSKTQRRTMANPRICPHCHEDIPTDRDFTFDEKLNLICGKCGKVAFPTTAEAELAFSQVGKTQPSQIHHMPRHKPHHEDIPEG
jgi:hypothetical protein